MLINVDTTAVRLSYDNIRKNKRFTKSCLFLVIETCIVVKIPFPMFHIYGSSKQVNEKVIREIPPKNPIYFHEKEPYLHLIIPPHEKQFVNECHSI